MLKSLWDDFRGVEVNPPPKKTGITVTEAALKKIETMVDENGMIGVRPYVYGGGCSGMAHSMTFVDQIDERDTEVAPYLYIDPIAYQFMDGATIDYDISGMSPTFIFKDVFKAQGGTGTCGVLM
jgi:iron-sulfur cluster assembly accessory protein